MTNWALWRDFPLSFHLPCGNAANFVDTPHIAWTDGEGSYTRQNLWTMMAKSTSYQQILLNSTAYESTNNETKPNRQHLGSTVHNKRSSSHRKSKCAESQGWHVHLNRNKAVRCNQEVQKERLQHAIPEMISAMVGRSTSVFGLSVHKAQKVHHQVNWLCSINTCWFQGWFHTIVCG